VGHGPILPWDRGAALVPRGVPSFPRSGGSIGWGPPSSTLLGPGVTATTAPSPRGGSSQGERPAAGAAGRSGWTGDRSPFQGLYFFWWAALAFWTQRSFFMRSTGMSIFSARACSFGAVRVASCS